MENQGFLYNCKAHAQNRTDKNNFNLYSNRYTLYQVFTFQLLSIPTQTTHLRNICLTTHSPFYCQKTLFL